LVAGVFNSLEIAKKLKCDSFTYDFSVESEDLTAAGKNYIV